MGPRLFAELDAVPWSDERIFVNDEDMADHIFECPECRQGVQAPGWHTDPATGDYCCPILR